MEDNDKDDNNNKDNNNDKGISVLGLDRDMGFSQGHQGYLPYDNNKEEEDDVKVEDNDKDYNTNKDNNNNKGISDLGLDKVLEFSQGHQGH